MGVTVIYSIMTHNYLVLRVWYLYNYHMTWSCNSSWDGFIMDPEYQFTTFSLLEHHQSSSAIIHYLPLEMLFSDIL